MTKREMINLCNYIAKERNRTIYCPIVINPNLVTMLGRVVYAKSVKNPLDNIGFSDYFVTRLDKIGFSDNIIIRIEFSEKLLKFGTKEAIITAAIHELAHAFVFWDTRKPHGHDMYWKAEMRRMGIKDPKRFAEGQIWKPHPDLHKYEVYCKKCGRLVAYRDSSCPLTRGESALVSGCCEAPLRIVQNWN